MLSDPLIQFLPRWTTIASLKGLYRRIFLLNFGVVEPGRVYRSARPGHNLSRLKRTYRLASILDLQGDLGARSWRIAEVRTTGGRKIDHFRFPIAFGRRPLREELFALITLFENCRYPLLIHCFSGADRTGLASGLYLMSIRGRPPERAFGQAFSLQFGHVPVFGAGHLHEPFREYAAWLEVHRLKHSPARFKFWLGHVYGSGVFQKDAASDSSGTGRSPEEKHDLPETDDPEGQQPRGQKHPGGRAHWPSSFQTIENWARERYPIAHRCGMRFLNRFSEDLGRRYPSSFGAAD